MALAEDSCACLPECEGTEYQYTATSSLIRWLQKSGWNDFQVVWLTKPEPGTPLYPGKRALAQALADQGKIKLLPCWPWCSGGEHVPRERKIWKYSGLHCKHHQSQTGQALWLPGRDGARGEPDQCTWSSILFPPQNGDATTYKYDAWEDDIATLNIFFGQESVMGKVEMNISYPQYCWDDQFPSCAEMERSISMGPVEFVSSLGGLFGLFLGFSVISFCEILYWATVQLGRNIIRPGRVL